MISFGKTTMCKNSNPVILYNKIRMQKKFQLITLLLLFSSIAFGQAEKQVTEAMARFIDPKCEKIEDLQECKRCADMQMLKIVYSNLVVPQKAVDNHIAGNVVVTFTVTVDGTLDNIKVLQGLGYGCDEAALEAVKKLGRFQPAIENGKEIPVDFTLPIRFRAGKR